MATQKGAEDWLKLSQEYWKGWQDLTRQAMGGIRAEQTAAPWHEGLEQWARLFRGGAGSSDMNNVLDQLLDHGRGYLNFLQQAAQHPGSFGAEDLRQAAQRMVEELRQASPFAHGLPFAGTPFGQQFSGLVDGWRQSFESMQQESGSWLRMPSFGMAREYAEQAKALAAAQDALKAANQRYAALIAKALEQGLERFQTKLVERGESGSRRIEDMRGLYDLFIDGLEEAYAESALSAEFRAVYGELVNAQSRVRLALNRIVEQVSGALGMPTRSEVNTLGERLQAMRRELRRGVDHPAIGSLKAEIDQLREELAALRASQHGAQHDDDELPPAPRPATAGRKPAVTTRPASGARSTAKPGARSKSAESAPAASRRRNTSKGAK